MEFLVNQKSITESQNNAILLFVAEDNSLFQPGKDIDEKLNGFLSKLLESKDLSGKAGETHTIPQADGPRLIVTGVGKANEKDVIKAFNASAAALKASPSYNASVSLEGIKVNGRDAAWLHEQLAIALQGTVYKFDECKSKKEEKKPSIEGIEILAGKEMKTAVSFGQAVARGMMTAKRLGDLPANVATPSYLAEQAQQLAAGHDRLDTQVLDEDKMEELGMGSFLSVSKGSIEPGKLICMEYKGGKEGDAPHVLVGKGITFDTGGISLKPGAGMDEMKYDMCGAASVLGTMAAIVELNLPVNFIGVIAAAENMPAGHASKPGDIVTAMNGTTIEILNTDAEGRLVLCDALTYAIETYKPASIVDIATLTGACMMALGNVNSGLFTQDEEMAHDLQMASDVSQDAVWRLPLQDEYQELLDSNFADIANIGGRLAGATTAACFLSRFTEGQKWAHLDIAGTAWHSGGKNKGASGRPVPLLVNYIASKA
ncbi:leucyl aminopeptidase [Bermanella marisrubri]|uniref:Probable cytosol aminopeptidase n=1 Tax=Bermanella marisrubri TaxID=207949 RepID=Q1N2A9_9GAMM|nr:leucyl aminopeptidase [Bermanella marisrubri]EAT12255.1 Leucyl aminopeptidase [Bermanella marisrubri]QIZ85347.1 leucyl aminopeptidase [Bermanella marisrubri]